MQEHHDCEFLLLFILFFIKPLGGERVKVDPVFGHFLREKAHLLEKIVGH